MTEPIRKRFSSHAEAEVPLAVRSSSSQSWGDVDWQKLWLTMQDHVWSSLSIVPAGPGAPSNFALTIAVTLAHLGILHLGQPIQVADATGIPLIHLMQFSEELGRMKQDGERVIVALAPISENPITVSLAHATDASVLCVLVDTMSSRDAQQTVQKIGAPRFLGSAIFHPQNEPRS